MVFSPHSLCDVTQILVNISQKLAKGGKNSRFCCYNKKQYLPLLLLLFKTKSITLHLRTELLLVYFLVLAWLLAVLGDEQVSADSVLQS